MSAQVTEAHRELLDQLLMNVEHGGYFKEAAQLIADSEAKAVVELKKRADHWCDMHTVCAKERDRLRAEVEKVYALVAPDGCDLAPRGLFETARAVAELRAEVERLRECCDQTSALCGKFITEDDGTDLIPNSARIANALARMEARAERAEAELKAYRDAVDAQPWASDLPIRVLLDQITSELLTQRNLLMADAEAQAELAETKVSNQAERIRYLEGATNHATGTPLSIAIARAESAESQLHALRLICGTTDADKFSTWVDRANTRAEKAESELAGIRALADRRNKRDHSQDTTHQLVAALDQALEIAQAELAAERAKVRVLRSACENICEEWGKNHDAPFCAGSEMEKLATAALAATEDAT